MNELKNRFNQYEGMDVGGGQLTIPQHFRNKSENLLDEFDGLLSRDEEHSKVISSLVKSWPEFVRNMEMLTSLVEEQNIELCGLKVVEDFAMEFSSHQMQLQVSNLVSNLISLLSNLNSFLWVCFRPFQTLLRNMALSTHHC